MASDRIWEHRNKQKVILDTNAILMLFEFSINLEKELTRLLGKYQIIIPKQVYNELKKFSEKKNGKIKQMAKPAIKLLENYEIVDIDNDLNADESVFRAAKTYNGIILTNDKELKKQAKREKIKTIFLRNKSYLEMM